ncbi:MAG: hypothetical protein PHT95_03435, partial [Candidatus Omnitrophica bacterium]|nr:hypothetical protein [Candidatus Omnitrophota bacterium]
MINKPGTLKKIHDFLTRGETISVMIIIVFLALALSSIFVSPHLYQGSLHEGDISLKNVYAPYDFTYQWDVNEDLTEKAKMSAADKVPYYLKRDPGVEQTSREKIEKYFSAMEEVLPPDAPPDARISRLIENSGVDIGEKNAKMLADNKDISKLRTAAASIVKTVYDIGYVPDKDINAIKTGSPLKVAVVSDDTAGALERKPEGFLSSPEIKSVLEDLTAKEFPGDKKIRPAMQAFLLAVVEPNISIDEKRTEAEKTAVIKKVQPVYNVLTVKKNEVIVEKGKRVSARHLAQMAQLRSFIRPGRSLSFFFGVLLLFMLLGLVGVIDLSFPKKINLLKSPKQVSIVFINMLFMIVLADIVVRSPQPTYFIPMSAMAMMITLLVGINTAFLSAVLMSILISVLVGGKVEILLVMLVGSTVGISMVREARRRSVLLWAGLLVGVAQFLSIVCVGLVNSMEMDYYIVDGFWGLASGVLSSFIVM